MFGALSIFTSWALAVVAYDLGTAMRKLPRLVALGLAAPIPSLAIIFFASYPVHLLLHPVHDCDRIFGCEAPILEGMICLAWATTVFSFGWLTGRIVRYCKHASDGSPHHETDQ